MALVDIYQVWGYKSSLVASMAFFRPKGGQNGHLKDTHNIKIDVNRPCGITNFEDLAALVVIY